MMWLLPSLVVRTKAKSRACKMEAQRSRGDRIDERLTKLYMEETPLFLAMRVCALCVGDGSVLFFRV